MNSHSERNEVERENPLIRSPFFPMGFSRSGIALSQSDRVGHTKGKNHVRKLLLQLHIFPSNGNTFCMRKKSLIAVLLTVLCALFLFCACDKVEDMGSLPDLSRPYTGEYTLKKITLGGEDYTEKFESVKLSLDYDGEFELTYKEKDGQSGSYAGEYTVSTEREEITFSSKAGLRSVQRTFPMKNGSILIDLNFGAKLLHAEFAFPE